MLETDEDLVPHNVSLAPRGMLSAVPGKKNVINVKKFLAALSTQSSASHNPKKMSTIQELPASLKSSRWTKDKLEMRIKEKIEARSKGHGFPNYFRVFCDQGENVSDRITLDKEGLRGALQTKLSIHVDDEELEWLFSKWDSNNSGEIDLQEFLRQLLPKDYTAEDPWSYQEPRDPGKSISYQKPPAGSNNSADDWRWVLPAHEPDYRSVENFDP